MQSAFFDSLRLSQYSSHHILGTNSYKVHGYYNRFMSNAYLYSDYTKIAVRLNLEICTASEMYLYLYWMNSSLSGLQPKYWNNSAFILVKIHNAHFVYFSSMLPQQYDLLYVRNQMKPNQIESKHKFCSFGPMIYYFWMLCTNPLWFHPQYCLLSFLIFSLNLCSTHNICSLHVI